MENKKTKLIAEDANLFKDMEGKYVSSEEKEFFERMKFKIECEPAPANDLIMSNRNNDDGIYIVRCYDYEFRIGCHVGEEYKEEFYAMDFHDALNVNLRECGFIDENLSLLEWLRKRNYKDVEYNHNFDLM